MGSFAYSLHVKSGDTEALSAAIEKMMAEAGYRVTEEAPVVEMPWSESPGLRALYVFGAYGGWSGILDSDMTQSADLAAELSRRLDTYAIQVMVNDSDSWHYLLFHNGDMVDQFNSVDPPGGLGEFDDSDLAIVDHLKRQPPDEAKALELKKTAEALQNRMYSVMERIEKEMPPDVRAALDRIKCYSANPEDVKVFEAWHQEAMQQSMNVINETKAALVEAIGVTMSVPPQEPARKRRTRKPSQRRHLAKLRPILHGDVADKCVLEVLGKKAVFAEEVLGEFFELLGVQPVFASLSYVDMQDLGEEDLNMNGICVAKHLRFAIADATR